MYLRFTTKNIDEETGLEKGIFSILNELYDSNELHDYEQKTIRLLHHNFPDRSFLCLFIREPNEIYPLG